MANRNQKKLPLPERTAKSLIDLTAKHELLIKTALLYSKELSEELIELWDGLLDGYSVDECSYAFEHHMRNGKFFPKPADILETIRNYRETNALFRKPPRYEKHGEGYGENEIRALWQIFNQRYPGLQRRLSDEEVDELIDELDRKVERETA